MLPEPNPAPGAYYVSCIDGPRWALLLGPFVWHATALAWVPQVRELAYEVDPKSWFFGFGTCGLHADVEAKPGKLNALLGIAPEQLRAATI